MVRFRFYCDKDKEQKWLNEMANKGFAVTNFFLGFYTFKPCKAGEYIYQIDLLSSWKKSNMNYKEFFSENNIEIAFTWFFWIALRKKSQDGEFILYTDNESKIEQYTKIKRLFLGASILEFLCFLMELTSAIQLQDPFFGAMTVLIVIIIIAFMKMVWTCQNKIDELKNNQ